MDRFEPLVTESVTPPPHPLAWPQGPLAPLVSAFFAADLHGAVESTVGEGGGEKEWDVELGDGAACVSNERMGQLEVLSLLALLVQKYKY